MKEESTKHEIPNTTPCRITGSNWLGERDTNSGRITKLPLLPSVFSLFTLSLILSLCMLIACDKGGKPTYEDGLNEGLRKGWEAGAKAMAEEMVQQATEMRRLLRDLNSVPVLSTSFRGWDL